jgi:hypothetical protein
MRQHNLTAVWQYGIWRAVTAIAALSMLGTAAMAGVGNPDLSVNGGTGVPGGTAAVTVALANDPTNLATSGDVDFTYPTDLVEFMGPVTQSCMIASRIADTHEVGGRLVMPGLLRLSILVSGQPAVFPPLGDGDLASCNFHILPAAPTGSAPLAIQEALLFAGLDMLSVSPVNGAITISEATVTEPPTATPTPVETTTATATSTGEGGTPTATNTGEVSPTATGTVEIATATSTAGSPTATNTAGSPTVTRTVSATSTRTGAGSPTITPTTMIGTATVTRTGGTPTRTGGTPTRTGGTPTRTAQRSTEDDGCNIVPTERASSGGTLALLLMPALLVWARRRRF